MNIVTAFEAHATSTRVALHNGDISTNYRDLFGMAQRVHGGLEARGVVPGDRILLVGTSTPEFVACLLGILRAGAVVVPVNPFTAGWESGMAIGLIDPVLVFAGAVAEKELVESHLPCPLVALEGPSTEQTIGFPDFLDDDLPELVECQPDTLAFLSFTRGTSGAPKIVMLTHGSLWANFEQLDEHSADLGTANDVLLGVSPLSEFLGLKVLLNAILKTGASVVLAERFEPAVIAELLGRLKVTVLSAYPSMWHAWATMPGISSTMFEGVRLAISGGALLSREIANLVDERLGVLLVQEYGLTEASPILTLGAGTGAPVASVGRPLPGIQLRLVGTTGEDVPVGDEGEVWAKGRNVFRGYWNNPEATAEALTPEGWLRTGDIAVVDEDGFLFLVDRLENVIVVSGFNVFPGEVEAVLCKHSGIQDALVVGINREDSGEVVKGYVVPASKGSISETEIVDYCAGQLAPYKVPTAVEIVAKLPRREIQCH